MPRAFARLADEQNVELLAILKIAHQHDIDDEPTKEELEFIVRKLSGYYDLSNSEIRSLADFLETNVSAARLLGNYSQVMGCLDDRGQEEYLKQLAMDLHELLDDPALKKKMRPDTMYMTIMNLGLTKQPRSGTAGPGTGAEAIPPLHLLQRNPDLVKRVVADYFIGLIEGMHLRSEPDLLNAEELLRQGYTRLLHYDR